MSRIAIASIYLPFSDCCKWQDPIFTIHCSVTSNPQETHLSLSIVPSHSLLSIIVMLTHQISFVWVTNITIFYTNTGLHGLLSKFLSKTKFKFWSSLTEFKLWWSLYCTCTDLILIIVFVWLLMSSDSTSLSSSLLGPAQVSQSGDTQSYRVWSPLRKYFTI